ncbi:MAG: hypothetical protein AAF828_03760 [Bacteroidota bacterium]
MKAVFQLLISMLWAFNLIQGQSIPFTPSHWEVSEGDLSVTTFKGKQALQPENSDQQIISTSTRFTAGTIEYDIHPVEGARFDFIYFRRQDQGNAEAFYLRPARARTPNAPDAIQYAGFAKGINLWDLSPHFQSPANLLLDDWNRVKLVISKRQMLVYINDMTHPTLTVPSLQTNWEEGQIAFQGKSYVANVKVSPLATEGLSDQDGYDPTANDPYYIRNWQHLAPIDFPKGQEPTADDVPDSTANWMLIQAGYRGLINLTEAYGASLSRRLIWLQTEVEVPTATTKTMNLGFNDEVWVFLNGSLLYLDKNLFRQAIAKADSRCQIDNASFQVPLQAGKNTITIAVANDFFGWGMLARLY